VIVSGRNEVNADETVRRRPTDSEGSGECPKGFGPRSISKRGQREPNRTRSSRSRWRCSPFSTVGVDSQITRVIANEKEDEWHDR
jgi:hypothetical protein